MVLVDCRMMRNCDETGAALWMTLWMTPPGEHLGQPPGYHFAPCAAVALAPAQQRLPILAAEASMRGVRSAGAQGGCRTVQQRGDRMACAGAPPAELFDQRQQDGRAGLACCPPRFGEHHRGGRRPMAVRTLFRSALGIFPRPIRLGGEALGVSRPAIAADENSSHAEPRPDYAHRRIDMRRHYAAASPRYVGAVQEMFDWPQYSRPFDFARLLAQDG